MQLSRQASVITSTIVTATTGGGIKRAGSNGNDVENPAKVRKIEEEPKKSN